MPSHPLYYTLHTPNQSQQGKKWVRRVIKNRPKLGFVGSIVSVYILVAALLGFAAFNGFRDQGQASVESAYVSASLRLIENEVYQIGSRVEVSLTLQNTSIVEPINNLNIELRSTKNAVVWQTAMLKTNTLQMKELKPTGNIFVIPFLTAGERAEYKVVGTLADDDFDFLTLVANITFRNREGLQTAVTNRVFTKIEESFNRNNLLKLEPTKLSYKREDKVELKLFAQNHNGEPDPLAPLIKGKVYITQKDTKNTIASLDCQIGNQPQCVVNLEKLEPGNYTAIFISEDEQVLSQIAQFKVEGQINRFKPSDLSTLHLPFNNQSINGIVPVIAKQVMGLNDRPSGEKCVFEIIRDEKVVETVETVVQNDRICATILDSTNFKAGNGGYTIKLQGTSKSSNVLFLQKFSNLINIENITPTMNLGNSVQIFAKDIPQLTIVQNTTEEEEPETEEQESSENPQFYNGKAVLGIWHPRSGEFKEVTNFGGTPIQIVNGQLNLNIPASEFVRGGFYSVFIKLEDGRYSDFLGLSFEDKTIGFSYSGVIVENLNDLKVGQDFALRLENVVDRSGNRISQGECAANIYQTTSGPIPITVKGELLDGNCRVVVPKGKITRSGPILVTFVGDNIVNPINQSRQLYIAPNKAEKFGFLGLEYEPAMTGYANNFIIGPVTDLYGNTTNVNNLTLQVFDLTPQIADNAEQNNEETSSVVPSEPKLINEYILTVEDGFAKVTAPSTLFNTQRLKLVLLNEEKKVIKEKIVEVVENQEENQRLILPNFPRVINSDSKVKLGISGVDFDTVNECKLSYFKSEDSFSENKVKVNAESSSCEFDWNLNQNRDNQYALMQLQVGSKLFSHIVKHTSGQASNLFVTAPQIRINDRDEIELDLLTSPIADINGRPVEDGMIRWQINNKTQESRIKNGFSKLVMNPENINSQDIRRVLDQKFLEISLDGRASVTAINRTKTMSIYLGNKELTNARAQFEIKKASTQLLFGQKQIFQFRTNACDASILSDQSIQKNVSTHWQGGICYVEVGGSLGNNSVLFEQNGFNLGQFDYLVGQDRVEINWCSSNPCKIQVITQNRGNIQGIIYDGDNQYKFETDNVDNVIEISQNGLNPLRDYLVEVRFYKNDGAMVSLYNRINGELLQSRNQG